MDDVATLSTPAVDQDTILGLKPIISGEENEAHMSLGMLRLFPLDDEVSIGTHNIKTTTHDANGTGRKTFNELIKLSSDLPSSRSFIQVFPFGILGPVNDPFWGCREEVRLCMEWRTVDVESETSRHLDTLCLAKALKSSGAV